MKPHHQVRLRAVVALAALMTLVACAEKSALPPIPAALVDAAQVPGFAGVRQWGEPSGANDTGPSTNRPGAVSAPAATSRNALNVLAISGGGANGSFAAGFLTGWTRSGTRPQFHIVTGVSVGALAAPFAFLGPEHDAVLHELFTRLSGRDIINVRPRVFAIFGDALASSQPLQGLIARYFDAALMRAVAAEHRKGRRLYVASTHLYAGRQTIWDIGAIAVSGRPEALALIQRVLLASAAVPILLPPVYFEVEAEGRRYSEMHVDGGITRQAFIGPPDFDWSAAARALGTSGQTDFWVIRNGRALAEYMVMPPEVVGLGEHAMHQLTQSLGVGDLYVIYLRAEREGAQFHGAWIGNDFSMPAAEWFDPAYVRALFDYGSALARSGRAWNALPPGLH